MKPVLLLRVIATLSLVLFAYFIVSGLWQHYEEDPWTRDGRINADIAQVAPDVSGTVSEVLVRDNQTVRAGTPLFIIDQPRYQLAVRDAQAKIASLRIQVAQALREARRNRQLGDLVPAETREQSDARVAELRASIDNAQIALDVATLNLERTTLRAPVDGTITNFSLRPGNYAVAGKPALAIIDKQSIHVIGYFEETKLPRIAAGDKAHIHLMGESGTIEGHVASIASGIEDRERGSSPNLLANVNPTFNWVRLAQRIPVRIAIDRVPAGIKLVVGRTATIEIEHAPARRQGA